MHRRDLRLDGTNANNTRMISLEELASGGDGLGVRPPGECGERVGCAHGDEFRVPGGVVAVVARRRAGVQGAVHGP